MAKNLINITQTTGSVTIGQVVRRHDDNNWFGTFFASGVYGSASLAWSWQHATVSDTSGVFPMKDLSGNAVTSTSASGNDSFNSEFGTGKNNTDKVQLLVVVSGATSNTNLNVGYYDKN